MNFTREPIIETIISAKDGHKLSVRSSKNSNESDCLVDAVEVVSFGGSFFYRSQERAKAFFLPSGDYEIQEVKETRLIIKNPTLEKSVKIGTGKDGAKQSRSPEDQKAPKSEEPHKADQKRDKRKYKKTRRQVSDAPTEATERNQTVAAPQPSKTEKRRTTRDTSKQPQTAVQLGVFSHLLKPPERLISETIDKYKQDDSGILTPPVDSPKSTEKVSAKSSKSPRKTTKAKQKQAPLKESDRKEEPLQEVKDGSSSSKSVEKKAKKDLVTALDLPLKKNTKPRAAQMSFPPAPIEDTELYSEPPSKGEKLEEPKIVSDESVIVTSKSLKEVLGLGKKKINKKD